jgi:hypothetical protein
MNLFLLVFLHPGSPWNLDAPIGRISLSNEFMAGRWQPLRKPRSLFSRLGGADLAFRHRCNTDISTLLGLPNSALCLGALRSFRVSSSVGTILSCETRRKWTVGRRKGAPNSVVENGCSLTKIMSCRHRIRESVVDVFLSSFFFDSFLVASSLFATSTNSCWVNAGVNMHLVNGQNNAKETAILTNKCFARSLAVKSATDSQSELKLCS